ncbi:MAG: hypothetical protein V1882_06705 [Candidatus Omnitrophota bacterium]
MKKLLKKHPRMIALLFGCAVLIFMFVCGEIACWLLNIGTIHKAMENGPSNIEIHDPTHYQDRDSFGIRHDTPGFHHVQAFHPKTIEPIFDIHHSTDQFRRRVTPVNPRSEREKFAIFMGCSFTYGYGVNGNETFPYYFGQAANEFTPYNYGFGGLGPFDFLAMLENYDFSSEIKSKNGVLVYLFIDPHIERTIGSLVCLLWMKNAVYYEEVSRGIFKRRGTFESGRFFTNIFYKLLLKSRLFKASGMDIPPAITKGHIALTARVIEAMNREFKKKYPKGTFYFVISPNSLYGPKVGSFLKTSGIQIIDFSNLFDSGGPQFRLRGDGHPSPLAYQLLGKALAERIAKDSSHIQN